jgi:hypothetical protein
MRLISGIVILLLSLACSFRETQFYSAEEANRKIIGATLVMDARCAVSHRLTFLFPFDVSRAEFDTCLLSLYSLQCSAYSSPDPFPTVCKSLLIYTGP